MAKKSIKSDSKLQSRWERQQRESQQRSRESQKQQLLSKQRAERQLALEEQPPPEGFTLEHILRREPQETITGIAWSPDGRLLAFAVGSAIHIWDMKGGESLPQIFAHFSAVVTAMAWSPDGQQLVSYSADGLCYFLSMEGGDLLSPMFKRSPVFNGNAVFNGNVVTAIAWSPDGRLLALSLTKGDVHVWSMQSDTFSIVDRSLAFSSAERTIGFGNMQRGSFTSAVFWSYSGAVTNVAWSPDGRLLASSTVNGFILLWDVQNILVGPEVQVPEYDFSSGQLVLILAGYYFVIGDKQERNSPMAVRKSFQANAVIDIAWSPDSRLLASSSANGIISLWDPHTGKLLQSLEGHTDIVLHLSFSSDNRFLASKSDDGTVRLWNVGVWQEVATLNESSSGQLNSLAFHPTLPILATLGRMDKNIRIWNLDKELILRASSATSSTHHYVNAKVMLIGDSAVGKSGLGLVLAKQAWQPTESTHGRYVWPFDDREIPLDNGRTETRQILLWDLAGQPGYRLIHQLHLNEVSVALVVFDGSSETNPFAGVHHWVRALRIAQEKHPNEAALSKKFLVAARIDRGGIGVSQARIDALKHELGFEAYFETSAKEGVGIEQLQAAITNAIPWEQLPKVSSTVLFQSIKDFLMEQKELGRLLSTREDLYHTFLQLHTEALPEQFNLCIGRVESRGLIRRLSFGNLVLLQPELLDAYASALVNAVKEEPDGLGSIAEEKILTGSFAIPSDERIANKEQEKLLLIAMVEDLLSYEIALRESADDGSYLIFPSQSTRENVDMPDPEEITTVFSFEGPVLNIYATLTVRLSHSGLFRKKELWRNAITYEASVGGTCGLLLRNMGEGRGEFTLFFDKKASNQTRLQFEQYVSIHLQRRVLPESIQRKSIFLCRDCGFVLTAQLVRLRKERNYDWVNCPVCQTYISLNDTEEQLKVEPSTVVQAMDLAADKQRDLATAQSVLQGKRRTRDFDVFLCHNGLDTTAVKRIGEQLKERRILPWLDEWELRPGMPWQRLLEEQIETIKSAAILVGKNGREPWQQLELDAFLREFVRRGCPVIPVLLATAPKKPKLPIFLSGMTWVDFRKQDPDPMERLIWGITGERSLGQL